MDVPAVITPPSAAKPLRLEPFRALLLAASQVGAPSSARAFARPYRAVATRLDAWEASGRMTRAATPALYLHEYTADGLTVRGLVGALAIDRRAGGLDERAVCPHEGIHPKQVRELATRMFEMGMNPAPILLVHEGPEPVRALIRAIAARPPDTSYLDRNDQTQRIWSIDDPAHIRGINSSLADGAALIADGHHRYAAYLQIQQDHPGTPWDRGLAMLVDQMDTPLFLGAIHRNLVGVTLRQATAAASAAGASVLTRPRDRGLADLAPGTLLLTDSSDWAVVTPPSASGLALVDWLHTRLVSSLPLAPAAITFHHTADDALSRADLASVSALLPAPDFGVVRDLAIRGRLLPEKTTSFQPKPSLGAIMRSVRDEAVEPR